MGLRVVVVGDPGEVAEFQDKLTKLDDRFVLPAWTGYGVSSSCIEMSWCDGSPVDSASLVRRRGGRPPLDKNSKNGS